jgi:hypothetical protein
MWLAPVSCEWFGAGDLHGDVTLASCRACVGCGGDVLLVVGLARWCSWVVLWQLHELIQADFAKNHLKALKCFVEVDLLKCDRLLSQL